MLLVSDSKKYISSPPKYQTYPLLCETKIHNVRLALSMDESLGYFLSYSLLISLKIIETSGVVSPLYWVRTHSGKIIKVIVETSE